MAVKLYFLKDLSCKEREAEKVSIDDRNYHVLVADYDIARSSAEVPEECKECLRQNCVGEILLNP